MLPVSPVGYKMHNLTQRFPAAILGLHSRSVLLERKQATPFYTMYNFNLSVHLGSLTIAVGAMYAKEYFPESAKKVADDMVKNIK